MRKYLFLVFVLIAGLLMLANTEWQWTNVGKTWNVRPILVPAVNDSNMDFTPYESDSDAGPDWTERWADRAIDSLFITGHCDNTIKIELWCVGHGDSSWWQVVWHYGNHRSNLLNEIVFDTSLAAEDTVHVLIDVLYRLDQLIETPDQTEYMNYLPRSNFAKWGSVMLRDSLESDAGTTVEFMLIEYDQ